jgi:hypothetical protein
VLSAVAILANLCAEAKADFRVSLAATAEEVTLARGAGRRFGVHVPSIPILMYRYHETTENKSPG